MNFFFCGPASEYTQWNVYSEEENICEKSSNQDFPCENFVARKLFCLWIKEIYLCLVLKLSIIKKNIWSSLGDTKVLSSMKNLHKKTKKCGIITGQHYSGHYLCLFVSSTKYMV